MSQQNRLSVNTRSVAGSRDRIDRPLVGIALMVVGILLLGANDAMMKVMVERHPIGQVIFLRGAFALPPMAWLVWRAGGRKALVWQNVSGQLACVLFLTVALFLFVYALAILPLGLTTIMVYTNPLMVTALAPFVLGERVGWRRWSAVVFGFLGAALVFFPGDSQLAWGLFLPLIAAFFFAFRDLLVRLLVTTETSISIFVSAHLAIMAIALITFFWGWNALDGQEILLLAINGLIFCFAIYFLTESYRYAEASLISPFKYVGIVVGLLLGFLIWQEVPSTMAVIGASVIVMSGLFITFREKQVRRIDSFQERQP